MHGNKLTTHEVLQRCEITAAKTLTRWHQKGLIPPPIVETHPKGRGKIAYWPPWIVFRIREVKAEIGRGRSLDEIADALGSDWTAEEKRWIRKKPDIKALLDLSNRHDAIDEFSEATADVVYYYLQKVGVERPGAVFEKLWRYFGTNAFIDEILLLFRQGFTPVIVITGDGIRAIPDFLLASVMTAPKSKEEPILVVPIRDAFLKAFERTDPPLPKDPKFIPASMVIEQGERRSRRRSYRHKEQWKFTFQD